MADITSLIKQSKAEVYRRAMIKRRDLSTGLFEPTWLDISSDVKSYGKITSNIDSVRLYQFTFGNMKLVVHNDDGKYNPEDSESSLWYGHLNQQRTLVRIDAGFVTRQQNSNGIWINTEYPARGSLWDLTVWDGDGSLWDQDDSSAPVYIGVISGDIQLSDSNEVAINVKPLTQVFQDFYAENLTGWTTTGCTASQFIAMLRDQQDVLGSYIFRPFFGDTTTGWDIQATTSIYANLNSATSPDIKGKTCWDIIETLAEAENFVPYTTRGGIFRWADRSANTTTVAYEFHGAGSQDSYYGSTIKSVNSVSRRLTKYYSAVQVKWNAANTSTSYETVQAAFNVEGSSTPWVLGSRTLQIENLFIQTSTVALTLAQAVFNDYSSLKKEVDFITSFVPHLDLLDRFAIYYEPTIFTGNSLWDGFNWAYDSTDTSSDLIFDKSKGDAIFFDGQEFKFLSFEIDLDNLQNRFVAREV